MRLIDADALIEEALTEGAYGYVDAKQIADSPTIDAVPVRHGRWYEGHEMMTCTNCCEQFDLYFKNDFNYCPNCGAKMEGG